MLSCSPIIAVSVGGILAACFLFISLLFSVLRLTWVRRHVPIRCSPCVRRFYITHQREDWTPWVHRRPNTLQSYGEGVAGTHATLFVCRSVRGVSSTSFECGLNSKCLRHIHHYVLQQSSGQRLRRLC